jgi:hypothetical protein
MDEIVGTCATHGGMVNPLNVIHKLADLEINNKFIFEK